MIAPELDLDEAPLYWEPWTPVEGQRVRIRLSGECQYRGTLRHVRSRRVIDDEASHWLEIDGATGFVDEVVLASESPDQHRFHITLDPPVRVPEGRLVGVGLAAIELEPLDGAS